MTVIQSKVNKPLVWKPNKHYPLPDLQPDWWGHYTDSIVFRVFQISDKLILSIPAVLSKTRGREWRNINSLEEGKEVAEKICREFEAC